MTTIVSYSRNIHAIRRLNVVAGLSFIRNYAYRHRFARWREPSSRLAMRRLIGRTGADKYGRRKEIRVNVSRRGFLKATGVAAATTMAFDLTSKSTAFAAEPNAEWKLVNTEEYTNICCYCAGGCGSLCSVRDGELINLEGDPDHPINQGGLCPKGATMQQLRNIVDPETHEIIKNTDRRTKPMVRRPGASDWEDISWDDAIKEIARNVKDTRDATFVETDDDGLTVNRCEGIASLGGSQQNSEEEYLILKMMRSLGVVAIDNQARV